MHLDTSDTTSGRGWKQCFKKPPYISLQFHALRTLLERLFEFLEMLLLL
jgi:hypothetical protein